ncbi:MAG: hypothetical protein HEEMFOPI_00830 [Holosporales bacterium]
MKHILRIISLSILIQGCAPVHLHEYSSPYSQSYSSVSSYSSYQSSILQLNDELNRLNVALKKSKNKKEKNALKMRIKEQKRIIEEQRKICAQLEEDRQRKQSEDQIFKAREKEIQRQQAIQFEEDLCRAIQQESALYTKQANRQAHYDQTQQIQARKNQELNRIAKEERDLQLAIANSKKTFAEEENRRRLAAQQEERNIQLAVANSKKTFAEEERRRRLAAQQEERDLQQAIANSKKTYAEESARYQNKYNVPSPKPMVATAPPESVISGTAAVPSSVVNSPKDPKRPGRSYTSQELGRAGALMQGSGQSRSAYLQKLEGVFSRERAAALLDDIINGEDNSSD